MKFFHSLLTIWFWPLQRLLFILVLSFLFFLPLFSFLILRFSSLLLVLSAIVVMTWQAHLAIGQQDFLSSSFFFCFFNNFSVISTVIPSAASIALCQLYFHSLILFISSFVCKFRVFFSSDPNCA